MEHEAETERREKQDKGREWGWQRVRNLLKVYEGNRAPIPMHQLLLFISIFSTKGAMLRCLKSLHVFKDTTAPDVNLAVEMLTALCLRESHDTVSTEAPIVTAMTILDSFAHRYGLRGGKVPPRPQGKEIPAIVQTFHKPFFICTLVSIIEAANILPGINFGRALEGAQSLDETHVIRPIYLGEDSVDSKFMSPPTPKVSL